MKNITFNDNGTVTIDGQDFYPSSAEVATPTPAQKTVREWLNELPDGYRERALGQCMVLDKCVVSMATAIFTFHSWTDTKEDGNFWCAVYHHYQVGTPLPPLPEPEKPKLPETWEELGMIGGTWITGDSELVHVQNSHTNRYNRNILATEAYAKWALAFAQLSQIYERWKSIEFPEWVADWKDGNERKFCPCVYEWKLVTNSGRHIHVQFFPFPTEGLCERFINCPAIAKLLREFYMVEGEE